MQGIFNKSTTATTTRSATTTTSEAANNLDYSEANSQQDSIMEALDVLRVFVSRLANSIGIQFRRSIGTCSIFEFSRHVPTLRHHDTAKWKFHVWAGITYRNPIVLSILRYYIPRKEFFFLLSFQQSNNVSLESKNTRHIEYFILGLSEFFNEATTSIESK